MTDQMQIDTPPLLCPASSSRMGSSSAGTPFPLPPLPPLQTTGEADEPEEAARLRFQLELEFVQCLANPQYLQFLAQRQYFANPSFLNYLAYLRYWQEPPYSKYITYPYSLYMLDLLQHAAFREACASADTMRFLHEKEYWHYRTYRKNRMPESHRALDSM
ncbi:mediator of RNA polymerase II transcription subunit 31-like protein [Fimicolochytrium jonesii]|uniref:mediator of RNA polymerase II transcription subunit 31-like protein n=1 Tax=Fimicolochytrium jonesii TaxID=1396493 RepID=UPI0022FE8A8C|nr:mediator of RNA polymerase II transcription subunit 31-like protein [Fimicolochytrium jonesii]KAI8824403.1 mediator of RNA polymerase II transcription subunit 31-like protein [Fimicolochytrium jonesii]